MTGFRRLAALLLALFALTACATRPEPTRAPEPVEDPAAAFPAKVQLPGQDPVTIPQQPKNIVSLSPTATETLYAVGAGDQVTAVDERSNHPERAPRTDLSGINSDAAAVASHDPDLVILQDSSPELVDGLRALDIPVLVTPSAETLDAAYEQIETIGQATGHGKQAEDLTRRMRAEIDKIVRDTPKPSRPLSYYHEISPDQYTATSQSFVGSVYSLFGLTNIADGAEGKFPQLSREHIIDANPDMIFLADSKCCGVSPRSVADRPGWETLTAVQENQVIPVNEDIASRWGPRVVDMVRTVSDAVAKTQSG